MEEIYKPIIIFNGEYEISNFGNCRSTKKIIVKSNGKTYTRESKVLKPAKSADGYLKCAMSFNGKLITKPIHRLVAETFIYKPDTYLEVNHIDGNKTNNNTSGRYYGRKMLAEKYNISEAHIKDIVNNRRNIWSNV